MVLDAVSTVEQFVDIFIGVYILVILIWVLLSWFRLPYSLNPVQRFLNDVVSPYLNLWRRIIPMVGPLDLSPIVGLFGLLILRYILDTLLSRLH
jgi:uncharacterized protein YggT (Ycf19 family)